MVRPKCLTGDFTNLCRIYKAHQTNAKWTLKVFHLHCWWSRYLVKMSSVQSQWTLLIISEQWLVCCGVLRCQIGCIRLDLFNDHTCPSGHISYLQIWASEGIFSFNVSLVKSFTLVYRYTLLFSNQLVKINGFVDLKSGWLCCAICPFVLLSFSAIWDRCFSIRVRRRKKKKKLTSPHWRRLESLRNRKLKEQLQR